MPLAIPCNTPIPILDAAAATVEELKARLLDLLSAEKRSSSFSSYSQRWQAMSIDDHVAVLSLVHALRPHFQGFESIAFLDVALNGTWDKIYTNVRLSPSLSDETAHIVYNVSQTMYMASRAVRELVTWEYNALSTTQQHEGHLIVDSALNIDEFGRVHFELQGHSLAAMSLPEDLPPFMGSLVKAAPFDSFDPNCTVSDLLVSSC